MDSSVSTFSILAVPGGFSARSQELLICNALEKDVAMLLRMLHVVASCNYNVCQKAKPQCFRNCTDRLGRVYLQNQSHQHKSYYSKKCHHDMDNDMRKCFRIIPNYSVSLNSCTNIERDICICRVSLSCEFSRFVEHLKKCCILSYWLLNWRQISHLCFFARHLLKQYDQSVDSTNQLSTNSALISKVLISYYSFVWIPYQHVEHYI